MSSSVLGVIDVGEVMGMGFWGIVLCLLLSLGLLM